MASWSEVLKEVNGESESRLDFLRKKYLKAIASHTKRNVISFYSGWLQVPELSPYFVSINDSDKTGLMNCCKGVDKAKGLDLILHTPGGDLAATESIIDYLHSFYNGDIRAFVPQIAMSGGTLIATACKEIWMGRQSSIGPVDPQFGPLAAIGLLDEFEMIYKEIKQDPAKISIWKPILEKLGPTDIIRCKRAVEWSQEILETNLKRGMLKNSDSQEQKTKIKEISDLLGQQKNSKAHARHINADRAASCGLTIKLLEDDNTLQDKVLSFHHLMCITFDSLKAAKIIANDSGAVYYLRSRPAK